MKIPKNKNSILKSQTAKQKIKIAFCASEIFPFAKTGGLADVAGALPKALVKKECELKVLMPFYKNIKPQKMCNGYGTSEVGGIDFIFIKDDYFFFRDNLYVTKDGDYSDNLERFNFFSKQVLNILMKINFSPDIIHCNDWQTSLVSVYLKTIYKDSDFFKDTKSVLTIHNLEYQGIFNKEKFSVLGLPWNCFDVNCLEFYGKINVLKGGIIFADIVNTVSPTYAEKITTQKYGCGLDGVLRNKKDNLIGVLNGIDYDVWNPETDEHIYKKYSVTSASKNKAINKAKLQEELGFLVNNEVMLIGMVSRLVEQKGLALISQVLNEVLGKYQLVILGEGEDRYKELLKEKEKEFKNSFTLTLRMDECFAHQIYAAADLFLMPSKFEPCGLSQMISYKYGTIPLVHHAGGLFDSVEDVSNCGGGIIFKKYNAKDLMTALDRASKLYENKDSWNVVVNRIMNYDFSWARASDEYISKAYRKLARVLSETV
ncbi:MAG: glycogen synthase [Candidatus Omnitrophica bacterium]|nr:glycogen synthase [Candidatus Omnitrophota bacterium]MCK5288346.1 glycogen synthase [Candidatus Omnitrophota bacterium]